MKQKEQRGAQDKAAKTLRKRPGLGGRQDNKLNERPCDPLRKHPRGERKTHLCVLACTSSTARFDHSF